MQQAWKLQQIIASTKHGKHKSLFHKRFLDSVAFMGNPSQSYGASPAVWDHTVLPATR